MRPDNWDEIIEKLIRRYDPNEHQNYYDKILLNAGADAMLVARNKEVRSKIICLDDELDHTIDGNSLFRSMVILEFISIPEEKDAPI